MAIALDKLTPEQLETYLHAQAIIARQGDAAARVLALRDYYDGAHPVLLTERQQEIIGALLDGNEFPDFAHNHVKSVIDTLRERLSVTGVNIEGATEDAPGTPEAQVAAAMWDWWTRGRLDAEQIRLYRRALRDGLTYVIVDFDNDAQRPRFTLHHVDAGEAEPGVILHRDPSDANKVLYATRYFTTFNPLEPGATGKERKTVYLPAEIRKYIKGKAGEWLPTMDDGDTAWPIPWVDRRGQPLGIPVIEFANPGGSEVAQIIPLQNLLNKAWLDAIAAADFGGFGLLGIEYDSSRLGPRMAASAEPGSEVDGDEIRVSPGRLLEVDDATIVRVPSGDLSQLIAMIDRIEQAISGVSRTPMYYLRPVGGTEVPSGEALKQLESGLVRRAEERQLVFGQSWEDVFAAAYRINQAFGPSLPELADPSITITWQDANVRNEQADAATAEAHQRLGVPQEELWRKLGYTPEQIQAFKDAQRADKQAQVAAVAAALRTTQGIAAQGGTAQFAVNGNGGTTA